MRPLLPAAAVPVVIGWVVSMPSAGAGRLGVGPYGHGQRLAAHASGAVAISADGRTAVVGDDIADPCPDAVCRGAVSIFVRSGSRWRRAQRVVPADGPPGFGKSVGVSGDGRVVVVGAQSAATDDETPAVQVLTRSGRVWRVAQTLEARSRDDGFGRSIAVSGDGSTVVVGDSREPPSGTGVAHVYLRSDGAWKEAAELEGSSQDFSFGRTAAISADTRTILVLGSDAARVFRGSGRQWKRVATLVPPHAGFVFLTTAALSPDGRVAVLTDDDVRGTVEGPGRAYVFVKGRSGWVKAQAIVEPGAPSEWNEFGKSAALAHGGRTLVVGAPLTNPRDGVFARGAVHVFARRTAGSWRRVQALRTPGAADFGASVAVTPDGSRIVVGALDPAHVLSR